MRSQGGEIEKQINSTDKAKSCVVKVSSTRSLDHRPNEANRVQRQRNWDLQLQCVLYGEMTEGEGIKDYWMRLRARAERGEARRTRTDKSVVCIAGLCETELRHWMQEDLEPSLFRDRIDETRGLDNSFLCARQWRYNSKTIAFRVESNTNNGTRRSRLLGFSGGINALRESKLCC